MQWSIFVIICWLCAIWYLFDEVKAMSQVAGRCIMPDPPMFGSVYYDERRNRLTYSCNNGFKIIGASSRQRCVEKKVANMTYYDWNYGTPRCIADGYNVRLCPTLENPKNGKVFVSSYFLKGVATYICDKGYRLDRESRLTCVWGYRWDKEYPSCQAVNVEGFAKTLEDKFISKYASGSADSEDGIQEKLSVGKAGLDIVFAVDVSSSIGPDSLENAKKFIKLICDKFGISKDPTGGKNGTRIALITFTETANVIFNLDDENIRSIEKVKKKVDEIQTGNGGTNFLALLKAVRLEIYIKKIGFGGKNAHARQRKEGANRALFIITDAEQTSFEMRDKKSFIPIEILAKMLRNDDKFEVFAVGVGVQIHKTILAKIASAPYAEHVFLIKDFKDLEKIGKIISEENDYQKCGISGNTEIKRGGSINEGAYPWLGWIISLPSTGQPISCGGALLCDKWFVTLASCVTEQTEDGLQTLEGKINLYLAEHDISKNDNTEIMLEISEVHVHPNYTGEVNRHGVRPFDIALLKIGEDNTTRPKLNKFIRPICFLEYRNNQEYIKGSLFLSTLKAQSQTLKGEVAGWGHRGQDSFNSREYFPWNSLEQAKREVRSDEACKRKFTGLDTDMFFCVGNVFEKESKSCHGDIGGPLMGEAVSRLYAVLGLALKTKGCTDIYDFSIFLNVFHQEINTWVERLLRGCNRIDEFIPYVEEDQDNTNETITDDNADIDAENNSSDDDDNDNDDDEGEEEKEDDVHHEGEQEIEGVEEEGSQEEEVEEGIKVGEEEVVVEEVEKEERVEHKEEEEEGKKRNQLVVNKKAGNKKNKEEKQEKGEMKEKKKKTNKKKKNKKKNNKKQNKNKKKRQ